MDKLSAKSTEKTAEIMNNQKRGAKILLIQSKKNYKQKIDC